MRLLPVLPRAGEPDRRRVKSGADPVVCLLADPGAQKLLFGDEAVPFKVNSTGGIETEVPHGSGTVEVAVEQADGTKSNSVSFTFLEVS